MDRQKDNRSSGHGEHGWLRVRIKELTIDWRMPARPRLFFLVVSVAGAVLLYLWWPELPGYLEKMVSIASK